MRKVAGPWVLRNQDNYESYVRNDIDNKPIVEYYLTLQNRKGMFHWRFLVYELSSAYNEIHKDASWNPGSRMRETQTEVREIVDDFLVSQGYELVTQALMNMA